MTPFCHAQRWQQRCLDLGGEMAPADQVLCENAGRLPVVRIARMLGRSRMACYSRLKRLGLTRRIFPWRKPIICWRGEILTPHDWLRREYACGDLDLIAETLGLTKTHLYIYAYRHGWRRKKP